MHRINRQDKDEVLETKPRVVLRRSHGPLDQLGPLWIGMDSRPLVGYQVYVAAPWAAGQLEERSSEERPYSSVDRRNPG